MFTEDMQPRRAPRSGYAKDVAEIEGYVRGFARRRPDVRVTTLRCANVLGPDVVSPLTSYLRLPVVPTVLGYDARLQVLHERDLYRVLQHAVGHEVAGTFNIAGDGILMLSQALRRLQRPTLAMPGFAVGRVGNLLRQARVADFSPEQLAFLTYGRGVDTTRMRAELGFVVSAGPDDRLLDPALGASALLDMGIYPLTFAHLMLGAPEQLTATASLSEGGIDLDVAIAGRYPGGTLATMSASMTSWSDRSAAIATDTGRVELHGQFHHPDKAVFHPFDPGSTNDVSGRAEPVDVLGREPVLGRGYAHEIAEVDRCVRAGLRESPLVPHDQTLAIMRQLDDVRQQVGVTHPADD